MIKQLTFLLFFSITFGSDSIPTWQIVYSKIYHEQFVKENTAYDLSLLQEQNSEFHKLVSQYFDTALDLIPVFSGYKWKKDYHINIYPNRSKVSFSHPMTIAYNKNQYFMFYTLIHEAVHHNMTVQFPTRIMDEAFCDKVAMKVAKYVGERIYNHRKYSVYYSLQKFYKWNLDSLSIKEWWRKNQQKVKQVSGLMKDFESELFHQNTEKQENLFNKIQNFEIQEFQEESFKKWIQYFEKNAKYKRAITLAKQYLEQIESGAYTNLIRFKLANYLLTENRKEEALAVLRQLKNSTNDINNYLDDLYVLMGRLSKGDENFIQAASQFLYVVETLPNGYAKAEAYQNLGRIYTRLENLAYAGKFYMLAFIHTKRIDKRAQLLIEMKLINGALDKADYKKKLLDVLRFPLKPSVQSSLERIYAEMLD
jgi:tetratricopeptide (TPR) repeat protein